MRGVHEDSKELVQAVSILNENLVISTTGGDTTVTKTLHDSVSLYCVRALNYAAAKCTEETQSVFKLLLGVAAFLSIYPQQEGLHKQYVPLVLD
jgi:hypothetical protein